MSCGEPRTQRVVALAYGAIAGLWCYALVVQALEVFDALMAARIRSSLRIANWFAVGVEVHRFAHPWAAVLTQDLR